VKPVRHAILTLHAKNSCAEILHASAAIHVRAFKDRSAAEAVGAIGVQIVGLVEDMTAGTTGVVRSAAATAVRIVAQSAAQTVVPIAVETAAVDALNVVRGADTAVVITVDITAEGTRHSAVHN
jgi:hypothetical protein